MKNIIGIIGMGHMGNTLYNGLLRSGFDKEKIITSNTQVDNAHVIDSADWIILTVKPAQIESVLTTNIHRLKNKIILSAAAGVTVEQMQVLLGKDAYKIIRIMPNIPAEYNEGVIGLWSNEYVSNAEKNAISDLFKRFGTVIVCRTEKELNAVTVIAACGPAFVAYFINAFISAGTSMGLPKKEAEHIALKTFTGTLNYLQMTNNTPEELQTAVATKGGLTEMIIKSFESKKIASQFIESLDEGYRKIK
jgi:pyrroline-5-carboxylate reductase